MAILLIILAFLVGVIVGICVWSLRGKRIMSWGISLVQKDYEKDPNKDYPEISSKYAYAVLYLKNMRWFL